MRCGIPPVHPTRRYRIGGARIVVASPDVPLESERCGDYLPFLTPGDCDDCGDADAELVIDVRLGRPVIPPGARLTMEAGEAWCACTLGDDLFIAPGGAPPAAGLAWVAAVQAGRRRATLTCGEALLVREGEERRLAPPIHYPLDQILLSLALAADGLILHAAAVQIGDRGLVLAGCSGAGKTTIARLCAAAGRPVLSDDRVVVRRTGEGWGVYGTPWPGEGQYVESRGLPLSAVLLLAKGGDNHLAPLPAAALARRLAPLSSIPWFDPEARSRCLDLLSELAETVPAHEFACRPDAGAARALAAAFPALKEERG